MESSWAALCRALAGAPAGWRVIAVSLLVVSVVWLTLATRRGLSASRLARRARRGRRGEARATALLARRGYRVIAAQVSRRLSVEVDGVTLEYAVQADFLVEDRSGRRLIAEVKTGRRAPDPLHPPTRRQLLEYALGYREAEGVLLVDVERGRVRRVRFLWG